MFKILNVLTSKPAVELLLFLLQNPEKSFYVREIAKNTRVSLGSSHSYLKKFFFFNFVKKEQKGKTLLYKANLENPLVKQLKIFFTLCQISSIFEKLRENSKQSIVYGSAAEGTNTSESDLDILIIADKKDEVKRISKNIKNLSPLILSYNEWLQLKEKDPSLYENIARGIRLW